MYRPENILPLSFLFSLAWSTLVVTGISQLGSQKTKVSEGEPPGKAIFKFPRRPNVIYSFNKDLFSSPARSIFQISPQGVVSNLVTLDREDQRGNRFTLTALRKQSKLRSNRNSDTEWTTTACSLTIDILDRNDNDPKFGKDLYVGTVRENSREGTTVQGLQGIYATDADQGNYTVDSYKILPGNGADKFDAVAENIGGIKFLSIRTRKVLNREDVSFYILTVQAVDGGNPKRRTGNTQIRINVLDVNDCSPSFKPAEYSMSVLSSTPVTTSVLKVHAQDEDLGRNGEVYYFFKTTRQLNFFTINPHNGVIRVARTLDLSSGNAFNLLVVAKDRGSPPKQEQTVVKVYIVKSKRALSSAESSPRARFAKRSYLVRVREDLPVNSHILHANTMHLARSRFAPVFTVLSDKAIPFQVDVNSGFLYLVRSLDFEMRRVYEFRLKVKVGSPNIKDEVNVTVHVDDVDENLHAPVFKRANLEIDLKRSSKSSELIQELKASDKDRGVSGLVKYYIRGGNGAGRFIVDKNLGKVYSKAGISWAGIRQLELLVEARDCARLWKSSMVFLIINVVGYEDCSPVFARSVYNASLRENQAPGTFVVVANAEDCEKGSKVIYSITDGDLKRRFEIDQETGIVRTRKTLDREDQHEYILEITAKSRMLSKAQVFIRIEDVNDNNPVFASTSYKIGMTENRGRVNNLLCLLARDKDAGINGQVTYEIIEGNDKNLFTVNANTGTLSSDSLNYEDQRKHTLIIRATDHGVHPRSTNTTVKISVTDINDPPKFTADDITVDVLEEKPQGSTVKVLPVSDEDEGENGEFVCSYENIDAEEFGKFQVKTTAKGCEVQNMVILDWYGKNIYSLLVRVTDKASPRLRKSDVIRVTVQIKDINNHAPVFSQKSYWASTPEDTPLSTSTILNVNATDKDNADKDNAKIHYTIANQTNIFAINARDGSVTAIRKLQVKKYELLIYAEDKGSPKRRTAVTCYISVYPHRVIFPPTITGLSNRKLAEDVNVNTFVTRVRLRGARSRISYYIVGGNIGDAFNILDGTIRVARKLNYERVKEYKLVIRAVYKPSKKLELAIEVPVKVRVQDVNDNKPSFRIRNHPLVINVHKTITTGTLITQVLAFDADSGANGRVTYDIKQRSDPIYFSIDPISGKIVATKPLESRAAPYTFTVVAEDQGSPAKRTEYEVQVKVHKDSKPLQLSPDQRDGSVSEGPLGINTKILTFNVNHGGENGLVYSIVKGNFDDSFCVDIRGSLYSAKELDRERRENYILELAVDDGESATFTADLKITVNDVNDNLPQFSTEPIRVFTKENGKVQDIGTLQVEDNDSGKNAKVSYDIVSTSTQSYSNIFSVDSDLGILIIKASLDHELAPEHVLTIAAQDHGTPSYRTLSRVIITVEDENDNPPGFLSHSFAERVPTNAPHDYPILRTLATDMDSGLNGEIRYAIQSTLVVFTIDESTGWIRVDSRLSPGTFSFNVSATDKGTPERSDTASVTITVEVGEGPPRFFHAGLPRGLHAVVRENQTNGSEVLTVNAMSRDLVTYAIYDADNDDFQIDPISGKISLARSLDFEQKQQYNFTVSATDRNDRMSLAHVTISILNVNDNRPRITNKNKNGEISCRINRHAALGSRLVQIRARDDDKHDRLRFSLSENFDQTHFSVDSAGIIRTKAFLSDIDYKLYVGVTVKDSGIPPLKDAVTVNVVLLNYDYNMQSSVRAEVNEGTRPGRPLPLSRKISPRHKQPRFSIVYPDGAPFKIDKTTGDLILKESLDYEVQKHYSLTVRMEESNNPKDYVDVDVEIAVKDENDNKPEFETTGDSRIHTSSIDQNPQQGTLIYQFKATDKDTGSNGDVVFRMGDEYPGLFQLVAKTGELKTTGVTLETKQYNVSVEAYDKGTPPLSTRTFIIVNVRYLKPEFTREEYQFEINENVAGGYQVGVVEAKSFGVLLTYQLKKKDAKFTINSMDGVLTLTSPVDYEKSDQRVFELAVVAKAQETSRARVTIRVRDVNDCAPKFYRLTYVDQVPETAPIGTTVLRLHARDDDSGLNAEVRYSLDSDDFIIDSYTGVVTTAVTLDYETAPLYRINVMAHDRGIPRLNGTARLIVNITNVNDNAPMFTSHEYSCDLWENAKRGGLVTTVKATDADKNTITYDITAGNNAGTFVINGMSGVIKLSNERSVHVVGPFYLLNVSASDGVHRGDAVVRVTIRDINDHAPIFTKCDEYSPAIPEGSPLGTSVLQVSASDLDLGPNGQVEYSIVHAHDTKVFQINRKTGLIETAATAAMFDRESRRKYPIRVKAIDGSSNVKPEERLEGSCFIEVTITDVNDNRPIFSSRYYSNIKESVGIGHHVLQVKALDNDEGENAVVSYVMKTTTSLFKIDKQTGLITTQADLMNKKKKHHLTILARDHGVRPLTSEVDVIVDVIGNDNDPPQFQQSFYDANVPEDSKLRSTVGDRIVATSKNSKHNVFYSITPGNVPATNNPRKFNIGPNDGVVFVVRHLDREITPNYTLTILAKNNANPPLSSSTILRIFLTDVNDCAPEFPSLPDGGYVGEIPENSKAGTSVLVVKAIDKDSGLYNKTVYSMDKPSKFFSIDSETGRIRSEKKFDREKKSSYTFVVKATDKGKPAWYNKVTVRVVVTDTNDLPPKFSQGSYNAKIHENVPIGTEVKTVSASDGDLGLNARITFDIKSGNEDDKFRILPDGRVLVNDNIDFEERQKYELVLRAWDGKYEDTATMTIRIENENDNIPIFNTKNGIQEAFVLESSAKGTTVTNLTATDRDLDPDEWKKRIKYHLSSQVTQIFRVNPNTGAVTTLVALDRETKATYKFQAYADDGDGWTGSVHVVVHVVDVNDNAPEFLKTSRAGAVRENMLPGTFVKKIEAYDKDDAKQGGNAVVRYAIHSDPFNAFIIDGSTARLKTRVTLDRENKSTYTLIVNATDGGIPPLTSRVKVVIQVLDDNDHAPKFIKNVFQKTILEDAGVGSSVLKLTASDDDIGVNARLRFFVLKDSLEGAFTVVPDTGDVVVAKQLDYEDKKSYEFEVKVEDGGFPPNSSTAKVIVDLQDSNDHSPYFDPTSYARSLPEGNYKNKNLLTLIAGDNDSTMKNKELRFSIVDGDLGNNFVVDAKTGVMRVRSSLDHETNPINVLTVRATNTAPPYLYSEGKVTITVTDINDNAPELTISSKNQEIFENDEGHRVIGKLHATDRDLDPNGQPFTFGILRGNKGNFFQLNKRTGELTTSATFDRENKSAYSLEVWIRDSGTPPLTNNVTVKVHVLDRNDNQHKEGLLDLTVNLFAQQTISPNIPVGKVFVVDSDTDDLRLYEMVTGDFNIFTLNKYTGEIYMKQRPASRKYTFRVDVSDRHSKFDSVKCKVRIKVNTIPTEAFVKSVALRFQNKTPEAFVRSFEKYKRTIAQAINTRPENVDLFSVQNAGGGSKAVDVRFGAHGSPYYAPERMIALLKRNRNRLTAHDPAVVIGYDACASEPCKAGGCKSDVKLTGGIEAVDDGKGKSFASIITRTKVTCGKCEDLFRPKTTCNSRPCLNGTCTETPSAFLCTCPKQYRGPRCELTTRSFQKEEWIWLRALRSCRVGNVSLEFSTLQEHGLLLYNGPMSELGTGDNYDFIAIQLAEGKVRVSLSLGEHRSTTLVISKSDKLNDGKWHSVEVFYNATFVRVVVDQCRSSLVKTSYTKDTEDRSNCERSVIIRSTEFNLLNINEPLQIGGMSSQPPEYTNVRTMSYDGCIRNVKENGNMYDLKTVSNSKGSREGCPMIDQHCHPKSPCYGAAECVPSRKGFSCICPPGYGGRLCDAKSADQAFGPRGFINYRLTKSFLKAYNPKLTKVEMMIRTRDEDGGLLMSIVDKEGLERLTLRIIVNERKKLLLEGKVNLVAGDHVVQLKNTFLGDGQWHHVAITRNRNEMHLGIDLNTNPRTASGKSDGRFMLLNINEDSDIFVGSLGHRGSVEDDFDGCIKDIRINGQAVGHNESNDVVKLIKSEGVTKGCESTTCQTTQCPALYFCYDEWKKSVCLRRPCNNRPCKNGAGCTDHAPNGVPMFKCLCRPGFNGTRCDDGASVIMLTGDAETINLKLVIGLSCFVFMLALATLLIICYHRYQTKGKAKFDTKENPKKAKKGENANKKGLVVIERVETDNGPKTNTLVSKNYPSMYSKDPVIHTCTSTQCPTIPPRSDSLETKETERYHSPQLPLWDIPPVIDVVISPDSDDSSPIYEDFIPEEEEEEPRTREEMEPREQRYLSRKYTNGKPSAQQSSGFFTAGLDWNIGEYGRKFYTMTRSIWGKDNDTRPSSGVSTNSNSSSVVTVVENPLA